MPNKGATQAAARWLFKETSHMTAAWEGMSLDSLKTFTEEAKVWLSDRSELKSSTIESADYAELLADFRKLAKWAPAEQRVEVPGLGRSVSVHDKAAPSSPTHSPKVQMTKEGIPTGRYAIETAYGLEFFWIKVEGARFMEHTAVRKLMDDGKWRMYYGGVRKVLELIKQAGWEAASRYGEAKNTCAICGRPLTVSAIKGIGPECEDQVGENPFGPNK